jgi:nucleotide-binding universal stress UspA family protein
MSEKDHPNPNTNVCPRRILVPVIDDAQADAAVFDQAAAFAAALHAEIVLLGLKPEIEPAAMPPAPFSPGLRADEDELFEGHVHERLAEMRDRVPSGVRSRAVLGRAPAGPAIVDAAREQAADLIVVPMRRGGEISHLFQDGADRHVLHHSPVPVLVVPSS